MVPSALRAVKQDDATGLVPLAFHPESELKILPLELGLRPAYLSYISSQHFLVQARG